jgi:hypothetical protein
MGYGREKRLDHGKLPIGRESLSWTAAETDFVFSSF